ncbi:hypothetical protein [Chitinophaga sancti]|uniref:Uncharacterized protein n=1 Tax=Chitinophaga sancti TaxID=1004 RepID=A0A1K1M1E5_9BACT|nr:hypothetical protein [Chitinophaga sancti]WQD64759.1 hypothetical protein U0033_10160 [Chitinophaga sancti]WQG89619.1 hypothetical protein SR876_32315 [Chitinophaga sancti]SFW15750.1 hypothetical protein SAMN05661012_00311 [Chitinophaga sancti]
MKIKIILAALLAIMCSCATVRKAKEKSVSNAQSIDTSSKDHSYEKETIIEEKTAVPVTTKPDSANTSGTMSSSDTSEYRQTVETNTQRLTTTVKPKVKDGKVIGYDINSNAIAKAQTINVPIDRKTSTKELISDKQKEGKSVIHTTTVTKTDKDVFRFNAAGTVAIVVIVFLLLVFLYLKKIF